MSLDHDEDRSPAQHIAVSRPRIGQDIQVEVLVFADGVTVLLVFLLVRADIWEWTLHT